MPSFAVGAFKEAPIQKNFRKASFQALERFLFGVAPAAKTTASDSIDNSFP